MAKGIEKFGTKIQNYFQNMTVGKAIGTLILLLIGFLLVRRASKMVTKLLRPQPGPTPTVTPDGIQWDPDPLAKKLYSCMSGPSIIQTCWQLWKDLTELQTDDQVRAVAKHFEDEYANGESLYSWIWWELPDVSGYKYAALERLKAVGWGE